MGRLRKSVCYFPGQLGSWFPQTDGFRQNVFRPFGRPAAGSRCWQPGRSTGQDPLPCLPAPADPRSWACGRALPALPLSPRGLLAGASAFWGHTLIQDGLTWRSSPSPHLKGPLPRTAACQGFCRCIFEGGYDSPHGSPVFPGGAHEGKPDGDGHYHSFHTDS